MLAGVGADCDGVARRDRQPASYSHSMIIDQPNLFEEQLQNEVIAQDVGKANPL
jgi:hypothetical protein